VPATLLVSIYSPTRNAGFDIFPDAKWPEDQQHDARSDILQRPLQRQSDREAGCAECRDDRGGLDAELAEDGDEHQDEQRIAQHVGEESRQRLVYATDTRQAFI